jgi:CBS domain-containing protein
MRPVILAVHADTPLAEVARVLTRQGISGAPVVSSAGRLVGVVSLTDLARRAGSARGEQGYFAAPAEGGLGGAPARTPRLRSQGTAASVMTRRLHSVPVRATLPYVARRMLEARIHRLFVESDGRLVGILSTTDVLAVLARSAK